jgi:hypothetical protein
MADLYYIDDGYYDVGYFVYTADAAVALSAAVTVVCAIEKTVQAQSNLSTTSTVSAAGGVVYNAVIAPVSLFSVGVIATVTSSRSIDCSATVNLSVAAVANRSTSITLNSIVTQNLQAARFRSTLVAITSTATVTATAQTISQPITVSISCEFTQTASVTRLKTASATITTAATQSTTAGKISGARAALFSQFAQTALVRKTARAQSQSISSFTATTNNRRIRFGVSTSVSTATQTVTARAIKRAQANITALVNIALDITEFNVRDVFIQSIIPPTGIRPLDVVNTTDDQGNCYTLSQGGISDQQIVLTKYSSRGKLVFKKKTPITVDEEGPIAIAYSNQNIYTMWSLLSTDNLTWRIELHKWDLFGNVVAVKRINNNTPGAASDIKVFDGSVYVSNEGVTPFLIKFDTNFNQQWYKTYNFGTNQRNFDSNLWIDSSGIAWVGKNDLPSGTASTRFTRINSSSGDIDSTQVIESSDPDGDPQGQEVVRDSAGNYYIVTMVDFKQGILKLNTNRQPVWFKVYNSTFFQTYSDRTSLAIDSADNLYFTYDRAQGIGNQNSIARGIVSMTKDGAIRYDATLDVSTPYSRFENTDLRINGIFFQLSGISWSGGTLQSPFTQTPRNWVLLQDQITNYLDNWTRTACGYTYSWTTNTPGTVSDFTTYTITNDPTFTQTNYTASYSSSGLSWSDATDYTECVVWIPLVGRSAMSSRFTSNVVARRNIGPIISSMSASATVTVSAVKTARTTRTLSAQFTAVTRNTRIRRQIAYLNSQATVSPAARKIVGTASNQIARFTTSQTARKTVSGRSTITAFNTVTSVNAKNATGTIVMESRATLNCLAVKTGEVVIQSVSTATTTINFLKQPQPRLFSVAASTTATMQVTARKIARSPVYLNSTVTANIEATYIIVNTFPMSAQFTLDVDAFAGYIATSNLSVIATTTSNTLNCRIRPGVISITAFATELVVGTRVTIDPFLTLTVPPETATKRIHQETSLLAVDSENRVNIITQEQRTITVPTETSTWHLPTAKVVGLRRVK